MEAKIIALIILLMASTADARDAKQVTAFRKKEACPATGKYGGPCVGWVINHKKALCLGGPDTVGNLEWQEVKESYRMDALEREACSWKKKYEALKALQ